MFTVRSYTTSDYSQLLDIQRECFPAPYPEAQLWNIEQIKSQVAYFPQGAMCVEVDGELIASCTSLIIQWNPGDPPHSWVEVADAGFIRTHNPNGNTLYGIDMAVKPRWRKQSVAKLLYQARFNLVSKLNLQRFMAAGRMPGYYLWQNKMTPEAYAQQVIADKIVDPVLTPQLRAGLHPLEVVHDYIPDEESADCALLFEWRNFKKR